MLQKLRNVLALFSPAQPELGVRDIARPFRWPKSTAYRLLGRMQQAGFLDRDEHTGLYRLGIQLAGYGDLARRSTSLQRTVAPALHRLSGDTHETATLMILSGSECVIVDVVESVQPLMLPGLLGGRLPLHATAGGKALIAWRPPEQQRQFLRPPLERYTDTTLTDPADVMRELERAHKRGYTTVSCEHFDDVVGVGAPIRDHLGEVVAALSVGGPSSRANAKLDLMAEAVMAAAASVSAGLGYRGRGLNGPARPRRPDERAGRSGASRPTRAPAKRAGKPRPAAPRRRAPSR